MAKPPPLTDTQKVRLHRLEPALRRAAEKGDLKKAKALAADIQEVLRPTGHETRLMQAKNWLFQAAMEAGELQIAVNGLVGIRRKVKPTTRVYLEATALLAICYLRRQDIEGAKPLMAEALRNETNIKSEKRRRQFRRRLIQRFEEETVLAALSSSDVVSVNAEQIHADAGQMLMTKTEDEILAEIGKAVPPQVIEVLVRVHEYARKQLPASDQKLLPPPAKIQEKREVGSTVLSAAKRVIWRSLCDPEHDVYKLWYEQGMKGLFNQKVLAAAVAAALGGIRVGAYTLMVSATAIILKMGMEIFCETWKPEGIMISLAEKE
jgi:hypothetical protein